MKNLWLKGCSGVCSVEDLSLMVELEILHLIGTGVKELGPLANCSQMKELDLTDCKGVSSIEPLSGCGIWKCLSWRRQM
ncbi:hypothetical protein STCU_10906 [Strigomonas culicis]|uniref:Uncharacterized protein n=1 Tax=Strigomonas culicis TaxID=28005 RepID=S9V280_9TRYP|nr:hypothetical protein STCU_10906 [Strigomonas culicis]|eukprot:EPY16930.1 hypothetical protein STCU_10906 [Strigomonas culicis]